MMRLFVGFWVIGLLSALSLQPLVSRAKVTSEEAARSEIVATDLISLAEEVHALWSELLPDHEGDHGPMLNPRELLFEREHLLLSLLESEHDLARDGIVVEIHQPLSAWLLLTCDDPTPEYWRASLRPYLNELSDFLIEMRGEPNRSAVRRFALIPGATNELPGVYFEFASHPKQLHGLIFECPLMGTNWGLRDLELSHLESPQEWWGQGTFQPTHKGAQPDEG